MAAEMYYYLIKTIERVSKKAIRKNSKFKFRRDFKYHTASCIYNRIMTLGEACSWCSVRDIKLEESKSFVQNAISINIINHKIKKLYYSANDISLSRQAGFTPMPQLTE